MNIIKFLMTAGKAPCTEEQIFDSYNSFTSFAQAATKLWLGLGFTPTSDYSISKVSICFFKPGSPTMNVTAKIYNNNTDRPGTQIGANSQQVNTATFPEGLDCSVLVDFIFSTPIALSALTPYWIVFQADAFSADEFVNFSYDTDETTGGIALGEDGLTWGIVILYRGFFITYSGDCS